LGGGKLQGDSFDTLGERREKEINSDEWSNLITARLWQIEENQWKGDSKRGNGAFERDAQGARGVWKDVPYQLPATRGPILVAGSKKKKSRKASPLGGKYVLAVLITDLQSDSTSRLRVGSVLCKGLRKRGGSMGDMTV